jgi:ATP-dependent DNA helicase RecG
MDKNKLRQLLRKHEGPKHDFKLKLTLETEGEKRELTRDVIAIANSRGGRGYIIFGVEDKTQKVVGINPDDFSEERIQQIIYSRSDPPVTVGLEFAKWKEKDLAVLVVYRSNNYPHQMLSSGAFFVRRGSTTDVARRSEIASMMQENSLFSYEATLVKGACKEDLDMTKIEEFLSAFGVSGAQPSDLLLEALGIISNGTGRNEPKITVGGMLLFGKNPSLYLPHAYIKIERDEDAEMLTGSILPLLEQAMEKIQEWVPDSGYPYSAVEEAVANALAHRDYLDFTRGITIVVKEKSLEITNPGALLPGTNLHRMLKPDQISRRNPWLYQRLIAMDGHKRFLKTGKGMNRMQDAFAGIGPVKFVSVGASNLFKVIFPRA